MSKSQSKTAPTDANPETQRSLTDLDFAGVYTNPGYGTFELCSVQGSSDYCTSTRSAFDRVDKYTGDYNPSDLQLVAAWPRFWATHIRLRPVEEHAKYTFSSNFTTLYTDGYGNDETPFEVSLTAPGTEARFVVDDKEVLGFGLFGTVDYVGCTERERVGRSVQEQADTWLERVR